MIKKLEPYIFCCKYVGIRKTFIYQGIRILNHIVYLPIYILMALMILLDTIGEKSDELCDKLSDLVFDCDINLRMRLFNKTSLKIYKDIQAAVKKHKNE